MYLVNQAFGLSAEQSPQVEIYQEPAESKCAI